MRPPRQVTKRPQLWYHAETDSMLIIRPTTTVDTYSYPSYKWQTRTYKAWQRGHERVPYGDFYKESIAVFLGYL